MIKKYFYLVLILTAVVSCKSKKGSSGGMSNREKAEKKEHYEKKFGVSFERETNYNLYASIDKWYGTPHKMGACEKSGIDCSCFVNRVYQEVYHCQIPRDTKGLLDEVRKIDKEDLREGDLVFFTIAKGNKVDHVGIYLTQGKFAHTSSKKGVMVSSLDEPYFEKAFKTGGRLKCS